MRKLVLVTMLFISVCYAQNNSKIISELEYEEMANNKAKDLHENELIKDKQRAFELFCEEVIDLKEIEELPFFSYQMQTNKGTKSVLKSVDDLMTQFFHDSFDLPLDSWKTGTNIEKCTCIGYGKNFAIYRLIAYLHHQRVDVVLKYYCNIGTLTIEAWNYKGWADELPSESFINESIIKKLKTELTEK